MYSLFTFLHITQCAISILSHTLFLVISMMVDTCSHLIYVIHILSFWKELLSLLRMVNQPDFSLEPSFIVDSIHMSRVTQEYASRVMEIYHSSWIQPGQQEEYQALWGNQEDTNHTCHHIFASKEAWAWVRTWTLHSCLLLWIFWVKTSTISMINLWLGMCICKCLCIDWMSELSKAGLFFFRWVATFQSFLYGMVNQSLIK